MKEYKNKRTKDARNYQRTKKGLTSLIFNNQVVNSATRGHRHPEYTMIELREWLYSQVKFHVLYSEWKMSNYELNLIPSVDRKHNDIHYCFSNIQLMTWEENRNKEIDYKKETKKGFKKVLQYSLDGEYIKSFESIENAQVEIGGKGISRAISENMKAKGFYWRYSTEVFPKKIKVREFWVNSKMKPIIQLSKNGDFIAEYSSNAEAKRVTKVGHIIAVCKGNRPFAGGFKWKYKEDYENN